MNKISNDSYKYILEELLKMSNDGFIVTDTQGNVVDINEVYAHFLGKPRDKIIGHSIKKVIPNSRMLDVVNSGYSDELAFHKYVPGTVRDESNDFVLVSRSCVKDDEGNVISGIAQVHFRPQALKIAKRMINEYNAIKEERVFSTLTSDHKYNFATMPGHEPSFEEKKMDGLKAAKTNFNILITGETGVGKEVFARAIHNASDRSDKPMISINCAAIPADLLESELFGYCEGSFTGAKKGGKKGKILQADGGTLFLDEIGDMPLAMQAKILRVIQEKEIDPIGSDCTIKVDVRILSATKIDLAQAVKEGRFREDLYYRINVINIEIPPLRKRRNDIPIYAQYFLNILNLEYKKDVSFSTDIFPMLMEYYWPGNLRELDNVIKGAYATCTGLYIEKDDIPAKFQNRSYIDNNADDINQQILNPNELNIENGVSIKDILEKTEYLYMKKAYETTGNIKKAAELLDMTIPTYTRKKKTYQDKYGE